MVNKLTYIESSQFEPYRNLGVEEHLLLHLEHGECILYLWQNQNTVVIGKNQNVWKECDFEKLEAEGGHLARRLSGGGAVFHDLGNLNFTFLMEKENYDVAKQLEVILRAVQKLGIHAEKSGRNDVLIDGRKFSGNAFYRQETACYHHGTLMVDVDMSRLSRYLTVSPEKLKAKGVDSVRSRVTNLREYCPGLTIETLKKALREAFGEVYGLEPTEKRMEELEGEELEERRNRFASWEWRYGKKLDFQQELSKRFPWGNIELQFQVDSGMLKETAVYSDSLKPHLMQRIREALKDIPYLTGELRSAVLKVPAEDEQEERMKQDIAGWLTL